MGYLPGHGERSVWKESEILRPCSFDWPKELQPKYALNPYLGCTHNCPYCWARGYAKKFGKQWNYPDWFVNNVGEEWKDPLVVENTLELLEQELEGKAPGQVLLSSMTDPYQPIEAETKLTRQIIHRLMEATQSSPSWTVQILTKATELPERDFDLLELDRIHNWFGVTITHENEVGWQRSTLIQQAKFKGLRTFVSLEPWMPGADALHIIDCLQQIVDFWIIGSLNKAGRAVRPEFYRQELPPLVEWMNEQNISYYIKKELRRVTGSEIEGEK